MSTNKFSCGICGKEVKFIIDDKCKNNIRYANKTYIGFHSDDGDDNFTVNLHLCSDCYESLKIDIKNLLYNKSNTKEEKKSFLKRIFIKKKRV